MIWLWAVGWLVISGLFAVGIGKFIRRAGEIAGDPPVGPCGEVGHPDAAHYCRYPDGTPFRY